MKEPTILNKNKGRINRLNINNPSILLSEFNIDYKISLQLMAR
jgi:hypothetical protein